MRKINTVALTTVFLLLLQGLYAQYTGQVNFTMSDVSTTQSDGWDVSTIVGCDMENDVGKPYLPIKHLHIAIPEDKAVASIQILSIQQQELTGTYSIMPTQPGQIPGEPEPDFVVPSQAIYGVNTQYPAEYIYSPTAGFKSGVHIAGVLYYPLTYNPVTQKLYLTTHLEYQLVYANEDNNPVKPRRMLQNAYSKLKDEIKSFVENPADIDAYFQLEKTDICTGAAFAPDEFPNFNGQPVEYVIITNETMAESFQEIANWKTQKGVPAVVRTVEWIYSFYPGVDPAEKVRNFIIDAYQNWGVQYVMLGGDSEQAPIRYAWIAPWYSEMEDIYPNGAMIPADMYFACLDGNWNADGDATYGEANWDRQNDGTFEEKFPNTINIDQVDRLPDIKIGRIPVEDYMIEGELIELNRFKTKFFEYIKTSQGNENNCLLFSSMGSIGYILKPAFPSYVSFTELYNTTNHNNMDVLDAFNGTGQPAVSHHIVCALGHGGPTSFAAADGSLNRTHMDGLINTDRGMIFCMTHCTTMPWDMNTVTEHFFNSENGGVAIVANTCVGWSGMVSSHNKPFISYIYDTDNTIGVSFKNVKSLYHASSYYDTYKRLMFFAHSIACEPEMPVWTDSPDLQNPLVVNVPASVNTGEQSIAVQISNLAAGVDAKVCLFRDGEIYALETITGTGSTVTANISCTPNTVDPENNILVTVTAKNYLPVEKSITVTANPASHLFTSNHTISGDENIDAGETIDLNIEVSNSGLTGCNGVSAVLSSPDNFITITSNQLNYGNIPAGNSVTVAGNFTFTVDAALVENQLASFGLTMTDAGSNEYTDEIYLEVCVPELVQRSKRVINTSNGDEIIEAGETVWFDIDLRNNSHSLLQNVNAVLSSTSGYVSGISQNQGAYGDIVSFETETNTTQFCFSVAANYPGDPEPLEFNLDAANGFGQQWSFEFNLLEKPDISDIEIDFRGKLTSIALFWTVYDGVAGYNIYRSDTETGSYALLNTTGLLTVAYFEDSGLGELTEYYYKVTAISPSGNESEPSAPKHAWTSLAYHPDWLPITVTNEDHGGFWGAPNVYDLEGDGEKEIFITSGRGDQAANRGTIFGFRHDGEELYDIDQNPTSVSGFANIGISMTSTPAIGDIDNDGIIEIVVATRMGEDGSNPDNYKVLVYKNEDADNDGIPDLMWEKQIAFKNFNGIVLADLNNNNDLEIIVPNQWGNKIEIFDCYGNIYPGWPVTTAENPIDKKAVSMPVAVDLDGNGDKEIVIGLEAGIYIWNHDGTDFITNQNPVYTDNGRLDCPVIAADIDNDDDYEILFMSIRGTTGYIYAIENDGSLVTGWDNDNHNIELSIQSQAWAWPPAFVCGDVDLDGTTEVMIADLGHLKVWDYQGTEILDKNIPTLQCQYLQPLVADVDGTDDACEIIVPSNDGVLYAYSLNGDPVLGWPLYLSGGTNSDPYIGDIVNDGKNEVIAASGSDIFVWDSEGKASLNQWGSFRLNSYNNAVYVNGCHYNTTPLVIDSDETWNSDETINSDLIVETNATLTVKSCLRFSDNAKLIIKPGGKLILTGGTITNACTGLWQGIEVWGNPLLPQIPANQGWLSISNGGTIQNAVVAVKAGSGDFGAKGGGIVHASKAYFRNNQSDVAFHDYARNNLSSFSQTTFETTGTLLSGATPAAHLSMVNVRGIQISGCTFKNTGISALPVNKQGTGIHSYNSSYYVDHFCISQNYPCTEYQPTTFENLYYGVRAYGLSAELKPSIQNSTFTNNFRGAWLGGTTYAVVKNCLFDINTPWVTEGGYGLYLDNSTAYTIEENNFYSSMTSRTGIGLIVHNSGSDPNEVYRNWFTGLQQGIAAQEQNRNIQNEPEVGLQILCCEFTDCDYDILIPAPANKYWGIAESQGASSTNPHDMAGNLFDIHGLVPDGDFDDINNQGAHISYNYPLNNYDFRVRPVDYTKNTVTLIGNFVTTGWMFENGCPPTTSGGGTTEGDLRAGLDEINTEIENTQQSLMLLTDGGNTAALYQEIETSLPPETIEIYNALMDQSPNLSDTVAGAAIDKEDVLPGAMLRDVMVANPQTAKSDRLMDKLDERMEPLPDYMKAQILAGRNITSLKEEMESQLAKHRLTKSRTLNALVDYYQHPDSTSGGTDSIVQLLTNDNDLAAKYQLALIYLQKDNLTQCEATLDDILLQFSLQGAEFVSHQDMISFCDLAANILASENGWYSATTAQLQQLVALQQGTAPAATYARNVLVMLNQTEYDEPIQIPDLFKSIIAEEQFGQILSSTEPSTLEVYPNPAKDYVMIKYAVDEQSSRRMLEIRNLKGELVRELSMTQAENTATVITRGWNAGTYIVSLVAGGKTTESTKFTINK